MKHSILTKTFRVFSIVLILSMIITLFSPSQPVRAQEDPFPLPDKDSDGNREFHGDRRMVQPGWRTIRY